jgi:hypothetical protein
MRLKILENANKMLRESKLMYEAKIWRLEDGWKGTGLVQRKYCKRVLLSTPRFAVNGVVELKLGKDSRRGKVLCLAVKFRPWIPQIDKKETVRGSYEWQINNFKFGSWAIKPSEELDNIGLGYIWWDPQDNVASRTNKKNERKMQWCSMIGYVCKYKRKAVTVITKYCGPGKNT